MLEAPTREELVVGSEVSDQSRMMTQQRIQWYGDGMLSASAGTLMRVGSNIHTDPEYARSQGLPDIIADGMISTNWISSMLVKHFGKDYVERGELRTKYIKPIFNHTAISSRGRIQSVDRLDDGSTRYTLEVWCEDQDGTKLTVGDAVVTVAPEV